MEGGYNIFAMCSPFVSYNLILNDHAVASIPLVVGEKGEKKRLQEKQYFLCEVFNQR